MIARSTQNVTRFLKKLPHSDARFFANYKISKLKDNSPQDKRQVFAVQLENNSSDVDKLDVLDKELRGFGIFTHKDNENLYVVQDEDTSFGNLLSCLVNKISK